MRRIALLVTAAFVAVGLAGCGSFFSPQPNPSTSTTAPPSSAISDVEAAKAYDYYTSPERRERIDAILGDLGERAAKALISGSIPSQLRDNNVAAPPYDEMGFLHTSRLVGGDRVNVELKYTDGLPTLDEGVLTLAVYKDPAAYTLRGERVTDSNNTVQEDTPQSWRWTWTKTAKGPELTTSLHFRDKLGVPERNVPIDLTLKYVVYLGTQPATEEELRAADDAFLDTLTALKIAGL